MLDPFMFDPLWYSTGHRYPPATPAVQWPWMAYAPLPTEISEAKPQKPRVRVKAGSRPLVYHEVASGEPQTMLPLTDEPQ